MYICVSHQRIAYTYHVFFGELCVYLCFTSHATMFQLYIWRHRYAGGLKKLYLPSGCHRHFVGFFKCPSYTDTGQPFLYGYSEKLPHSVAFYDTLGIRRMFFRLNPRRPHGGHLGEVNWFNCLNSKKLFTHSMFYAPGGWASCNPLSVCS